MEVSLVPLDLRVHAPARPARERAAAEERLEGGEKPRGLWLAEVVASGAIDKHGRLRERVWDPLERRWIEADPPGWD